MKIDVLRFRAVLPFVDLKDSRKYLHGVHMCNAVPAVGGGYYVATDGATMAIAHDPDLHVTEPVTITPPKDAALKNVNWLAWDDGTMTAIGKAGTSTMLAPVVDGAFPDWRQVTRGALRDHKETTDHTAPFLQSKYLARCTTVAELIKRPTSNNLAYQPGIRISAAGATDCTIVHVIDAPWLTILVMPQRAGAEELNNAVLRVECGL